MVQNIKRQAAEPEQAAPAFAHQVAALVKKLSDRMLGAISDATRDANGVYWVHTATPGRTLDALMKRGIVREDLAQALPRYRLTSTGVRVYRWVTGNVDDDDEPVAERPRGHMNMAGPDGLRHRVTYTRKPLCDQRQDWATRPLGGTAGPVNCPPCVLAEHRTEKEAAYWVTSARRLQGWQEPRDVPEWWPPVEPGELVEITPPPLVPLRIEPVRDAGGSVHGWALGFLMSAVERYLSADVSAEADRLRDKLAHAKKCVETNTIRPMPRRTSDSADEFERGYAKRSGLTVAELRATGRTVAPCHCGEPDCPGWQSVKSTELNGETR